MKIYISLLLVAGLMTLSCQRKVGKSSFGALTSQKAIAEAQNRAISKLNPYLVEKDQRIHTVETQEIMSSQGPAKFISKEWVTTVSDVQNFTDARFLTTNKIVTDRAWDENFIYEFKNVYSLEQVEKLQLLDQLNQNNYSLKSVVQGLMDKSDLEEVDVKGISFHNLAERPVTLVPPQLVKEAENCKGLVDCQIKADLITYDVVFLLSDGSTQVHNVEWYISANVPFFAAILKQCATTVIPVENVRVLVQQCTEVVDFDN